MSGKSIISATLAAALLSIFAASGGFAQTDSHAEHQKKAAAGKAEQDMNCKMMGGGMMGGRQSAWQRPRTRLFPLLGLDGR